jgi:hypothetical protein
MLNTLMYDVSDSVTKPQHINSLQRKGGEQAISYDMPTCLTVLCFLCVIHHVLPLLNFLSQAISTSTQV